MVFIGPAAGGLKLQMSGEEVIVITPDSPLGDGLIGSRLGDVVEVELAGVMKEYEIVDVM
jgi:transcription elongation GreA/GreB family factor